MGFRVTLRITLIVSVILLCIGIAISLYIRMSAAEKAEDFDLYTLVPSSATAIVDTDDMVNLIQHINELNSSKDNSFLYVSELFAHLKNHINTLLDDTPHGLSRHMNKMLVSFHEPDNVYNQVFYCRLGSGDYDLVEIFIRKYCKSSFPSKTFEYSGEEIRIYPMPDDSFLACYFTPEFLAVSYQKKLIEEVIDARKGNESIPEDPVFARIRNKNKTKAQAVLYLKMQTHIGKLSNDSSKTTALGNWTEFDMNMSDDAIYFSGMNHDDTSEETFMNVLRQQKMIQGFPGNLLPETTYFLHYMSVSNLHSLYNFTAAQQYTNKSYPEYLSASDRQLYYFLQEYANNTILSCQFIDENYENKPCAVLSIPVNNIKYAQKAFDEAVTNIQVPKDIYVPDDSLIYTPLDNYELKAIPPNTLFAQFSGISNDYSPLFSCFYGNYLLIAPDAFSLATYINMIEGNFTLENAPMYEESIASLSHTYNFLLMADMERVFQQPENYVRLLPNFFFRHHKFFRDFTLSVQFSCIDDIIYPNIVFLYKGKSTVE